MAENNENNNGNDADRKLVLNKVIFPSLIGIFVLAVLHMILSYHGPDKAETSKNVFNSMLPVVGTWIGTVIAYYYSKENFEAANKSVRDMVGQMTAMEKLQSIPAADKMIPKDKMISETADDDKIAAVQLAKLVERMTSSKYNRLPVLLSSGAPRYVIHRSLIDKYLTSAALSGKYTMEQLNGLTLKNLVDEDAELRSIIEQGYGVIAEKASLADAKQAMDRRPGCQDVFVTKGGTDKEPIIGWITNVIIAENAKV